MASKGNPKDGRGSIRYSNRNQSTKCHSYLNKRHGLSRHFVARRTPQYNHSTLGGGLRDGRQQPPEWHCTPKQEVQVRERQSSFVAVIVIPAHIPINGLPQRPRLAHSAIFQGLRQMFYKVQCCMRRLAQFSLLDSIKFCLDR